MSANHPPAPVPSFVDGTSTQDYRESLAIGSTHPLRHQWLDKPHRHVFDLCREIDRLNAEAGYTTVTADKTGDQ